MNKSVKKIFCCVAMLLSFSVLISCTKTVSSDTLKSNETSEKTYHGVSQGYNGNKDLS